MTDKSCKCEEALRILLTDAGVLYTCTLSGCLIDYTNLKNCKHKHICYSNKQKKAK